MSFYLNYSINSIIDGIFCDNKYYNKCCNILLIFIFIYIIFFSYYPNLIYNKYVHDCIKGKKYFNNFLYHSSDFYYLSICIPVYNMEKYIESSLLSILNQSFQKFEIILVNDNSNDKTIEIINKFQINDNRIKVINHQQKLGVYCARKDAILNANGKFILMMDPDDLFLNQDLFKELYNNNLKYNLDITEFLVYNQEENNKTIYMSSNHIFNHWHNYSKTIIYQPELSNIIFYKPQSHIITSIFCRTIWNKLIRNNIMIKAVNYVEKTFKSRFLITADDTPLNIMVFNFASNYSNIKIPGYLYIKKKVSMSRGQHIKELDEIRGFNFYLYYKFFLAYIKEYNKDINFFFSDFNSFHHDLYKIKNLNITYYIPKAIKFFNILLKIDNIPDKSKIIVEKLLLHFKRNTTKKKLN